jgi:hypothetical protein
MIDPVWNSAVENDTQYRELLIDIYAPNPVTLSQVDDDVGMQVLSRALKGVAMTKSAPEKRETYMEDNEDYGADVFRVTDVQSMECYYGYIYTQNNSAYMLKETVRPELTGLEIVWP